MVKKILLILILLLAFVLRFGKLGEVPPSLNWDEVSIGYNAYSILKTGKDEWGQTFPLHFKSYGEYKLPGQIYASIPAIAIFGLNDFSIRITPVIYGVLTVLLTFLVTKRLFKNEDVGLISSFLLAISPWHIQFTRASFESSFALFWIILGVLFLVKAFSNSKWLIYSTIPFAVSMYIYNSERIFVPFFLIVIFLIYFRYFRDKTKVVLLSIVLFSVLMLPLAPFVLAGGAGARYKLVSVTDDPGLTPRINENRGNSNFPEPLPRLIHNKITYVSIAFATNYLAHFTPSFLFFSGAPHKQHSVQGMGELYLFQAPFLLIGLYLLFKRRNLFKWMLVSWILIAFIPAAITNDSIPNGLRTLTAVPFYQIVSGYGIFEIFAAAKKKRFWKESFIIILTLTILVSIMFYIYNYFNLYPIKYSRDWQYGYKKVVEYIKNHKDEYDLIVFTRAYGEPHMFTLFYLNYDPEKFQNNPNLVRFETYDWIRVLKFDKFYFPDLGDEGTRYKDIVSTYPQQKILFIGKRSDFPDDIKPIETVDFLNGDNAFEIVEKK